MTFLPPDAKPHERAVYKAFESLTNFVKYIAHRYEDPETIDKVHEVCDALEAMSVSWMLHANGLEACGSASRHDWKLTGVLRDDPVRYRQQCASCGAERIINAS